MTKNKWNYRDISDGLKILRDFLLGRKHNLHGRFPPMLSPRSIPPADIPRAPEYKYSDQYYYKRNALDSVKPPVVAPIAEGPPPDQDKFSKVKSGGLKPDTISFICAPTPGCPWWWDGHCYYEYVPDLGACPPPPEPKECPPCPKLDK